MVEKKETPTDAEETTKEAAWNIAIGLTNEITNHLYSANMAYISGNVRKAFNCLFAAKMRIIQYLSPEERLKFQKVEEKIRLALSGRDMIEEPEDEPKKWKTFVALAHINYEKYNEMLMDKIETYRLGIPQREKDEGLF